jgi:23S rRNA (pseudouridine1915-N3)-methyltransferase
MTTTLCSITARSAGRSAELAAAAAEYVRRAGRFAEVSARNFDSEAALLAFVEAAARRTRPRLVLADSAGKLLRSEELAAAVAEARDAGVQAMMFAIGPADGWSAGARERADLVVSFGRITLPHELAAVVMAEQVYRAFTILAGHPYHSGH